jgi:CheY-like chemotaxis protein
MDDATRARMFEPFFTTKGIGKGTGLGLATVFGIVRGLDGHLHVDTAPGRGTTITACLPVVAEAPRAAEREPISDRPSPHTVLLVEDEPLVRMTARAWLERLGHQVLEAERPTDAFRIAAEHPGPIDLLLTDVVMPGASGRAVAERLRERHPHMRVLYMSAHAHPDLVAGGRIERDATLLEKPFDLEDLEAKLATLLD